MKQLSKIPVFSDKGFHVEILQNALVAAGSDIDSVDGDFGLGTKAGIKCFQKAAGFNESGVLDAGTLRALGLELKTGPEDDPQIAITDMVDQSGITRLNWENRGLAKWGYYHGMALMFATLYTRLKQGDRFVEEMAKPLNAHREKDALRHYNDVFRAKGMNNDSSKTDRLRHLFVLMLGLGVMESNGRYYVGKDSTADFGHGYDTEAGLFQTSYNAMNASKERLTAVFEHYKSLHDSPFFAYFSKGMKPVNTQDFGDGEAKLFQRLSKDCPAFTVEFTAIALRNMNDHWRPVRDIDREDRRLEIRTECNDLLKKVQAYLDTHQFLGTPVKTGEAAVVESIRANESMRSDLKKRALEKAAIAGQEAKLRELFDTYPGSKANYWGVVDFNKPANEERFFIFDLEGGSCKSYLVAHGENSGDLYANRFSNIVGSHQSSVGIYRAGETYSGRHGKSLKIAGLQNTNSNALVRYIVIHSAKYVVPNFDHAGRPGRSDGCFALNPAHADEVIENLKEGSYFTAWHKDFA